GGCAQKHNSAEGSDGQKTIPVLQKVQHNSIDAAYKGFKEGLAEEGYKEGDNLTIDFQNAQNNQDNLKSMSQKLVKEDPHLLLGIPTPAAQSILNETT
ncbi:ABC transporter substrate binding protein, partial [Enterococcus faecium]|uniref:ABC transporter substrate binding protein n=1 Tax=Enterococcus faecium TaxID=1352 RepID=UPI0031CD448B